MSQADAWLDDSVVDDTMAIKMVVMMTMMMTMTMYLYVGM